MGDISVTEKTSKSELQKCLSLQTTDLCSVIETCSKVIKPKPGWMSPDDIFSVSPVIMHRSPFKDVDLYESLHICTFEISYSFSLVNETWKLNALLVPFKFLESHVLICQGLKISFTFSD